MPELEALHKPRERSQMGESAIRVTKSQLEQARDRSDVNFDRPDGQLV